MVCRFWRGKKVPGGCKLALRRGGKETIGLYLQGCMSSLQNSLLSRLRSSRRFLPLFPPPHLSLEGSGERANKMMTARDREGESEGRNRDFEGLWERFCAHPCWFFPLSPSKYGADNGCLSKRMSPPALCDSGLQCITLIWIWKECYWRIVGVMHFGWQRPNLVLMGAEF